MTGPLLLLLGFAVAGAVLGGWPGAAVGVVAALLLTGAVAVSAATWAHQIGRALEPDDAWNLAPRPPLFRRLCDWVYQRTLEQ